MFKAISKILSVLMFFLNLWKEKDKALAEKKAEIGKDIVDAAKETDPDKQASKYNHAIYRISRLRK